MIRVHPVPALLGADLTQYGFIQEQLRSKEGYVEYDWKNPGETVARPKALYMTYFAPWDWIISASSYREEFVQLIDMNTLRESILAIRFGKTGYPFIIDTLGNVIVHPLITGNLYDATDAAGRPFLREMIERKDGKIRYSWRNPGETEYREKLVMFNYLPEFGWIIASSSYTEEFYEQFEQIRRIITLIAVGILLFLFLLTYAYTAYVVKSLRTLVHGFQQGGAGDLDVRIPRTSNDEIGMLSGYFNEFMEKLKANNRLLEQEIQERKRSEEALRDSERRLADIINLLPDPTFAIDLEGRITIWNRAAEEFTGVKAADMLNRSNHEHSIPFYGVRRPILIDHVLTPSEQIRKSYPHVEETGDLVIGEGYTRSVKRGEAYMLGIAAPLYDGEGNVVGAIESIRDISERKRMEVAIRTLNQELERRVAERTAQLEYANRELEAFSYSVSHDLRAPLRSIDGFSQILLEDHVESLNEEGKDLLRRSRAAAQRMAQLIDDLLSLSRVSGAEMGRQDVNLTAMAGEIAKELRLAQPDRTVEFVVQEGIHAQGDEHLLRIVLENLFGNAWKFTSKHPTARIEFGMETAGGNTRFYIRDDGAGFSMATTQDLFGPFRRLHASAEFPGTGIGLATVQRIIHRHGGSVWAVGEVEKGATFYFTLPRRPVHEKSA